MTSKTVFQNAFKTFLDFAINSLPSTQGGLNITATAPGGVGQRPFTNKAGVLKLIFVSASSLYIGGLIAHKGASYLEENEIFVPTDEDDDD
ncbi:Essential MCU regulator, mitochondrial [Caenorhabditis elegans]|uniref:Essential MCU regulator, mitochondrial n=1 Tax=Caenorhabditis elegans TaxID=6239 RepID=EMRE_CAEEL|nr:Essential MCU regulator, mitochondrial [Caenorhabditis elegans]Q9U3I4.1 RecName: Full=Essential MCU regulator, mitochondrial; Flags: Precursor [Caenorhabditis elegans]CAB54233.1 Essential MCU regulator, mitochondrial [Caenorhabditis elegans]|eukprot:NP_510487.1 Essential MCU regulator, mitochondrial [Caenorhabditis elegans]